MSELTLDLVQDLPAFVQDPIRKIDAFLCAKDVKADSLLEQHTVISNLLSDLTPEQLDAIPSLNDATRLSDKSLVRFTCMVQDMFDPEFYLATFKTRDRTTGTLSTGYGMYRDSLSDTDVLDVDYDSSANGMQDRMSYLCIEVPGENEWVREKRSKSSDGAEPMDSAEANVREDGHAAEQSSLASGGDVDANVKRLKSDKEASAKIRSSVSQCFPSIGSSPKKLAFVKVYDTRDSSLKLNDMIEVIGIMDVSEAEAVGEKREAEAGAAVAAIELDENNFSLPAVVAPQIHALCVRKVRHLNPLVPNLTEGRSAGKKAAEKKSSGTGMDAEFCERMRKELHAVLSLCLFGDELAAEYLICCLVSRIYSRQEILTLGSLSVGFSNLPPPSAHPDMRKYMQFLYDLMSRLVTHSVYLPMSLSNLNGRSFVPKKDHVSNKLVSGQLQLAAETLLFVDETLLETGKLEEGGLVNLKSLNELIKWQQVKYDFEYHSMEVNTDMKIVVFSEGKSLLPLNFRLRLEVRTL